MKTKILALLTALLLCCVCLPAFAEQTNPEIAGLVWESALELTYAREYTVDFYEGGYARVYIRQDDRTYLVVPEDRPVPESLDSSVIVLQKPLDRVYLQATSAMALIDKAGALDHIRLAGTDRDGWYVENTVAAMDAGEILYAGGYSEPDYELMINEGCDLAIESTMILHSPKVQEMIELLGIPVMIERSTYESHPLGRVEWIKLYGVLFDHLPEAETFFDHETEILSQFDGIENTEKTVAFFYVTTGGSVNVRASSDYVPRMIEIAGGRYIFDNITDPESNRSTVAITMEEFYNTAADADYMIYNASIDEPIYTLDELIAKDPLFADMKAVQNGNVWCTGKYLFQATDSVAEMIVDYNHMLTGNDEMTFLYKLN